MREMGKTEGERERERKESPLEKEAMTVFPKVHT